MPDLHEPNRLATYIYFAIDGVEKSVSMKTVAVYNPEEVMDAIRKKHQKSLPCSEDMKQKYQASFPLYSGNYYGDDEFCIMEPEFKYYGDVPEVRALAFQKSMLHMMNPIFAQPSSERPI